MLKTRRISPKVARTELRSVAEQAQQKFHDAEAAWELAAAESKKAFERSRSVTSDLTEKIEKRVGFLDATLKPLRSADAAAAEAETETRSAEEGSPRRLLFTELKKS
ncbi:hypothetical protein AK812_SmicGene27071 [Symbiodinium microadriaticum]|uniref:Uncharacterized protein n=1 Tax=Symbiodinium microadriaticum TaxID=2951 RepID=A0A1Q9D7W1_SYMMI|nr:hypothetical protein AK812_SmicGene27071 [Symbiodinium microadriaticum]